MSNYDFNAPTSFGHGAPGSGGQYPYQANPKTRFTISAELAGMPAGYQVGTFRSTINGYSGLLIVSQKFRSPNQPYPVFEFEPDDSSVTKAMLKAGSSKACAPVARDYRKGPSGG